MRIEGMDAINTGAVTLKANVRPVSDTNTAKDSNNEIKRPKELIKSKEYQNAKVFPGKLTASEKAELTISEQAFRSNLEKINKMLEGENRAFEYSVHEKTKEVMIKVINTETKEVIREIPPKKIVDLVASLCEIAGLFVDEKV